ncbi:hypothetical protein [Lysobacter sp. FW306-1B-D06B]|uniref:hypothetical protein n=1 Tax=Lysobacter sp. FW306-1B-D06B TaxID=3140250 RepID=UPI0031403D4E
MKTLPKIEAAEQLRLARETNVIAEVEALRSEIARKVNRLSPAAIVALACSRFSESTTELAFENFRTEVVEFLAALEASSEELRADFNAEKERIGPTLEAATRRHFAIIDRIKSIDGRISANQRNDANKRERLSKAGLKGAELESVALPTDNSALAAERADLQAENEALLEFIRTKDTRHLPDGFAREVREAA